MELNWYLDPITKHYADFQGVAGRKEFWMFVLYDLIITTVAAAVLGAVLGIIHLWGLIFPLIWLYNLAILLPSLGLGVRRMHDIGKSGWWVAVGLVPLIGWIIVLYLYCQPTTEPYAA
jgi:uncharacterized membrane protein YhaH (DUF805 family)